MKFNPRIKKIIKKTIPNFILNIYREAIINKKLKIISKLSREEKFSYIYKNNIWGEDEDKNFSSGTGARNPDIINPYIEVVKEFLKKKHMPTLTDCGCGDFNVGKNIEFLKLDIVKDNIPSADICIVRQVLQHFSNQDIFSFIKNIKNKFKFLLITEHLPDGKFKSNIDMQTSFIVRTRFNSGVLLHEKPFEIKFKQMNELLRVSAAPYKGVISTILYEF